MFAQSHLFQSPKISDQFLEGFITSNEVLNVNVWADEGEFCN